MTMTVTLFFAQTQTVSGCFPKTLADVQCVPGILKTCWRAWVTKLHTIIREKTKFFFVRFPKGFDRRNEAKQISQVVTLFEKDVLFHQARFDIFFRTLLCEETRRIMIWILTGAYFTLQRPPIVFSFLHPFTRERLHKALYLFRWFRAKRNHPLPAVF